MNTNLITTLIFDLGGVIIDLDVTRTTDQLAQLAGISREDSLQLYLNDPLFKLYETGKIDCETFRDGLRDLLRVPHCTNEELDSAWNAMILGLPKGKLDMLLDLKKKFQVMILSNTNAIHVKYINSILLPPLTSHTTLLPFVHEVYYSHEIHLRKPDSAIYEHVLKSHTLKPQEVVFFDDTEMNITTAQGLGIGVHRILHPDEVYTLIANYGGK